MREDMYKVIVERPRRGKHDGKKADKLRKDVEGSQRLGMRAGIGRPWLNENLSPLRRYLHAQVGRPWNKVYAEIAANIDRRNTVQQHIYQHLGDFIAVQVEVQGSRLINLREQGGWALRDGWMRQELYVDPRTGLIRRNEHYLAWRRAQANRRKQSQAEVEARRRIIDATTQLHRLDGAWFEVRVAPLPEEYVVEVHVNGRKVRKRTADARFDVVMKRMTARNRHDDRMPLYGSEALYAVAKRQLSKRELKGYGLHNGSM